MSVWWDRLNCGLQKQTEQGSRMIAEAKLLIRHPDPIKEGSVAFLSPLAAVGSWSKGAVGTALLPVYLSPYQLLCSPAASATLSTFPRLTE